MRADYKGEPETKEGLDGHKTTTQKVRKRRQPCRKPKTNSAGKKKKKHNNK